MSVRLQVGIFEREDDFLGALKRFRAMGVEVKNTFTPYPIHELDELVGIRRTRLPYVCFAGGAAGAAVGLWLQYWTTGTSWPVNIGGKPFDSWPAFVPVIFELLILFAGLGTVAALFLRSRLLPGRRVELPLRGVTDDRFGLLIAVSGAVFDERQLQEVWVRHHAVDQQVVGEQP